MAVTEPRVETSLTLRSASPTPSRRGPKRRRRALESLMVVPVTLLVSAVILYPALNAVYYSFTAWEPGEASPNVGLRNYRNFIDSPVFFEIVRNQAILVASLPLLVLLPLVIAGLLYERVPAAGVFRSIYFFPAVMSPVIIGTMFTFILLPDGPLNTGLDVAGLGSLQRNWLGDPSIVRYVVIAILAWTTVGIGAVIFAAALSSVPVEIVEAAKCDGAGFWRILRSILIPAIRPAIELWTLLLVINLFVQMFPLIYSLTRGGPGYSTLTLDYSIYQSALTLGFFGSAAAQAVILMSIVVVVVAGSRLVGRLIPR